MGVLNSIQTNEGQHKYLLYFEIVKKELEKHQEPANTTTFKLSDRK